MRLGAELQEGGVLFRIWAPNVESMGLQILCDPPQEHIMPIHEGDIFELFVPAVHADTDYWLIVDGQQRADPRSRYQPYGVHGPSRVVNPTFSWTEWTPHPFPNTILYELHVGTFTPEGTFEAMIPKLDHLKELGITMLSLMPVYQFSGPRNWGYDGVFPFAPRRLLRRTTRIERAHRCCPSEGARHLPRCCLQSFGS